MILLPWLVAWEACKSVLRHLAGWKRRAQAGAAVMLLSLVSTVVIEWFLFAPPNVGGPEILGLHALHQLPEIAVIGLLTVIAAYAAATRPMSHAVRSKALGSSDRIIWARAAGNYVEFTIVHSIEAERMTLRQAEMALDPSRFARIKRFMVINRSQIVGSRRGSWIRMSDDSEHRIGYAYRANLR